MAVINIDFDREDHNLPYPRLESDWNHLMSELTQNQINQFSEPDTDGEKRFSHHLFSARTMKKF